jgi:sigma54-dependent transcription regulator
VKKQKILLSWSGLGREPFTFRAGRSEPGAHLQLLRDSEFAGAFDRHLLLTVPETLADGERLSQELTSIPKPVQTEIQVLRLGNPTDHIEVAYALARFFEEADETGRLLDQDLYVLLNCGTPQMQSVWITLVTQGLLQATIIQTNPASLAKRTGSATARKVELDMRGWATMFRAIRERQSGD